MNVTLLESSTNEIFEITIADEPFVYEQFWRLWVVLIFSSLLVLAYLVPIGYIMNSRGKDLKEELAKKTGLLSTLTWVLEILDLYKDWVLLFAFPHATWAYLGLIFSIVFPFAFADMVGNNTFAHNLLNYFGLTDDKDDKQLRVFTVIVIAAFENIPQLIIVVCEFFYLKQSVTFVQAGNPIFGLFMVYKAMGLGIGDVVKREGLFSPVFIIFSTMMIVPQVFVTR